MDGARRLEGLPLVDDRRLDRVIAGLRVDVFAADRGRRQRVRFVPGRNRTIGWLTVPISASEVVPSPQSIVAESPETSSESPLRAATLRPSS